jgi:cytochrome c oxidase subunit 2
MDRERITSRLLAGVTALALAAQPVAAQTSSSDAAITSLNEKLLVVAIPITVLVEAVLIYTVYTYKDTEAAKPTRENRRLEITWTIATAAVLLFVGISASITMADESVIAPDDPEIEQGAEQVNVTAEAWGWEFYYPEHNVSLTGSQGLYLANGQETYLSLTTTDWLHAFHVPAMGLKHDAVPGKISYMKTTPTKTGTYQGYCAEYCGTGHSGMMFEVQVLEDESAVLDELEAVCNEKEFSAWNEDTQTCEGGLGNSSSNDTTTTATSAVFSPTAPTTVDGPETTRDVDTVARAVSL